jgi:hypothetical protein
MTEEKEAEMKVRGIAVLCLLALTCIPALAQEKKPEGAPGAAEMEAWQKAMTPGEPHKHLARMTGDWTFKNTMWMDPSQPPTEGTGTMHAETILGGRYVQSVWKGNFMGMDFEGRGTDGYDNLAKQYVSTWVDNMGSGIMYSTGSCDANGKVCTALGDYIDPMTNKKTTMRSVTTWTGDKSFKLEMYSKPEGGNETKSMEMVVTKK